MPDSRSIVPDSALPEPALPLARRRQGLSALAGSVLLAGAGWAIWWLIAGAHYASTDDAYVAADLAEVTPLVSGPVAEVDVVDTQSVHAGDVLVRLDDSEARIAVSRAEAELASARRSFDRSIELDAALAATVEARAAAVAKADAALALAKANLDRAGVDRQRRRPLAVDGAVSAEEVTAAENAFAAASANLALALAAKREAEAAAAAASADLAASRALTRGLTVETSPEVVVAQAKLAQASLDLGRMVLRAPIDGVVARRAVQLGQQVAAGAILMTIVPLRELHVDANFKEGQLGLVRPGQAATLTADLYGGGVVYHGRVAGFSGGTGAAFALIPAQNASGNWIKVVQRVPVRIELDPAELAVHPLRVGLSMDVSIDLASGSGAAP